MDYIIYRESWRRGGDSPEAVSKFGCTSLYAPDSKMMCCLGQCAFESGVPLNDMRQMGEPADMGALPQLISAGLLNDGEDHGRQSRFSSEAIGINDDAELDDHERERLLIAHAKRYGHTLTFVDGIAPWFGGAA